MQKVFLGTTTIKQPLKDITTREMIIMATLTISIVLLGLYPQPVFDMVKAVVIPGVSSR
jgi:NADH-quinone oxidoreductase subunit M